MEEVNHDLPLDLIHEFLNEELNTAFKRGGIMQSSSGTIEMTFHNHLNSDYVLVIADYNKLNRAEITERINLAIRMLSNNKKAKTLYLIFNCDFSANDLKFFSKAFPESSINIAIYDSRSIKTRIDSYQEKVIYPDKNLKIEPQNKIEDKTLHQNNVDYDLVARKIDVAYKIKNSSKTFWWINASKQFFEKLPIEVNDVYQYPIRINNGRRRANFSSLKIGDLLIGYDAKGTKEVYAILCVVREDDTFVFLKVAYVLDKPISWKQISEMDNYSNSIIIRSKATITLNKVTPNQFTDILLKAVSDLDGFYNQVMSKEFTSFKDEPYFGIDDNILKSEEGIEEEKENEAIEINSISERNNPSIAPFLKDTPDGKDYLNINEDVDAFSKVMALRDLPTPLSIALFGAWGSGKSFFMHKLEERIKNLTDVENPENEIFCKNIIHIKFNAWAYLDANLWASLASIIFEQIHNHIEGISSKGDSAIQNKIKEITDQLDVVRDDKEKISVQIDGLTTEKTETEKTINSKKQEYDKLIKNIQTKTTTEIVKRVFSEKKIKEQIDTLITEHKLEKFIDSSTETYSELVDLTDELKKIPYTFSGIFTKRPIVVLTIISLVVLTFFILGFFIDFSNLNKKIFLIPELIVSTLLFATPIFVQISAMLKKIKPVISSVNQIKLETEDKIQTDIRLKEQEIEKDKLKLSILKAEITSLEIKSGKIEAKIDELNSILNKGVFFETFKSTINHIHSSKVYKRHLGIISQLKHDFELISELFVKQLPELNTDSTNHKFIDRIILYLDDLDRCSENHVIEVLEAVNLLLAYPLFVVVVGVDHRWVKNALITKHHKQFGNGSDLDGYDRIEPGSYLEKIFQVPFHLNTPKKKSVRYMIGELVKKNEKIQNQSDPISNKESGMKSPDQSTTHSDLDTGKSITVKPKYQVNEEQLNIELYAEVDSKMLILSDDEIELLPEFDFLLGSNPRTIKRYVNIYRIVRSHGDLPPIDDPQKQKIICMFLVALAVGEHKNIFSHLSSAWRTDFNIFFIRNILENLSDTENKIRFLIEKNNKIKFLLDLEGSKTRSIGLFIERFSFKNYTTNNSPSNSLLADQLN